MIFKSFIFNFLSKYFNKIKKRHPLSWRHKLTAWCLMFLTIIVISSCEKVLIEKDPTNTPKDNFNFLYQTIKDKYSFLDFKKINWDSVKNKWEPQVKDTTRDGTLFRILDSMLYTLRDGHVNLYASFNISRNFEWYLNYPDNFDGQLLERNYLKNNYLITGAFSNRLLANNQVGYIRYSSFSNYVSDYALDLMVALYKDTKGIIIDVRNNGGGAVSNVKKIASRFTDKKFLAWKEAERNGSNINDFANIIDTYIEPDGPAQYTKPIIILTNRRCYSATTLFVAAMLNLPNVKVIGDWTGGGGGIPSSTQLPNGWTLRYSSSITTTPSGFNIENGTPPTIKQDMLKSDEDKGIDSIIERALKELQ
jgi:Peptidase family S41/Tricorn protease C1 domain